MSDELFTRDKDGKKIDAPLHDPILDEGNARYRGSDVRDAVIDYAVKNLGLTEAQAKKLY